MEKFQDTTLKNMKFKVSNYDPLVPKSYNSLFREYRKVI